MDNNNKKSVFERLDSIEHTQSVTQTQNEEILELLKNISEAPVKQTETMSQQQQISERQLLINFIKLSKKEYVWFGPQEDFDKSKAILNILCILLIVVGIISTILTNIAFKIYSTFTALENIWLIFVCVMFFRSINAKKRMTDIDLKKCSITKFEQDGDGTWRDTTEEKKKFKWFRRISYIAVIANIIFVWSESKGGIAIAVTFFEVAFLGLTVAFNYAWFNFFCMYGNFILFTGRNASNTQSVTLIFDVFGEKIAPYEEYKEKFGDNI